ncbi:thermostable hemolysin [Cycloclasticus pugetii]|uniref:thermostable hemolysin n=1 Tax=Cycloclasticus pugetii TaxID=34068 RepID=UPI00035F7F53|nr:thermostable hemolysin [Cycloclasticus pugetii]
MSALQSESEGSKQRADSEANKRVFLPHLSVVLTGLESPQRANVEAYITKQFYKNHAAQIKSFLPYLLSAETKKNITSVLGFYPAEIDNPMFLEQYLDDKAELVISRLFNLNVDRQKIAEIGNLTSSYPSTSKMLFVLIVSTLYQLDIDWALFTATKQVQSMISELDIGCIDICDAQAESLAFDSGSWGSYYKNQPKVIAGDIKKAYAILKSHPVSGFVMTNYQSTIDQLVLRVSLDR